MKLPRLSASWWRSNPPATTNRPWTVSVLCSLEGMRVWEGTQNSIARRISEITCRWISGGSAAESRCCCWGIQIRFIRSVRWHTCHAASRMDDYRSEEHTSELQSLTNLVCRLLLEK